MNTVPNSLQKEESQSLSSQWRCWMFIAVGFFLVIDVSIGMTSFPVRILLLQAEVWLAEGAWSRFDPE